MADQREQRFERRMSDAEALMWNVEKDPWLNPSGANVTIVDRPVDVPGFRARLASAVVQVPRLRERVVPGLGRLSPPEWRPDPEFDFDYHVRHIALPAPGSRRQLFDLVALLYQDPFDRSRPLWTFVVIDGLEGGLSAIFIKLHHSLADGIGQMRLSELYMEQKRRAPKPTPVDLDAVVAEAASVDASPARENDSVRSAAMRSIGHTWRRQLGVVRRAAGEVAIWGADPARPVELTQDVLKNVQQVRSQVGGSRDAGVAGGSPLWKQRSRHRQLLTLRVPLQGAQAASKVLDGTVNDFFVAGAVMGAIAYHDARDTPVEAFNISFVVSTRRDKALGGNAFTPARLQVPGDAMAAGERFRQLHDAMAAKRAEVKGEGMMASVAGVANLLPTSMVTRVARSQAATVDFATSNLRGARTPLYISGAKILENYPLGPVAGTAFNLTTISYNGSLDMGLFVDPHAVEDPPDLCRRMEIAYGELMAAGGVIGH